MLYSIISLDVVLTKRSKLNDFIVSGDSGHFLIDVALGVAPIDTIDVATLLGHLGQQSCKRIKLESQTELGVICSIIAGVFLKNKNETKAVKKLDTITFIDLKTLFTTKRWQLISSSNPHKDSGY